MIRKYVYGKPIPTGAVVQELAEEPGELPFFEVAEEEGKVIFRLEMAAEEQVFGLGESVRGVNKRGSLYRSWNSDVSTHTETQPSLYASHNLLVFFRPDRLFGVYLDDPGDISWDLGYTRMDRAEITSENGNLAVYLIQEDSLPEIAKAFRVLTGRSYLPPKWAFGYIQSRWGYASEQDIRTVAEEHRKRHIPLDAICLDIDYMDRYRNFTWKKEAFPDLARFCAELKKDHLRMIPIIDAGIPADPEDEAYASGREQDVFCKKADGSEFIAAVWPGRCVFTDFLREDARHWFGERYRPLLEAGIEGFWNDMNEPALFYSDEMLAAAFEKVASLKGKNLGMEDTWKLRGAVEQLANNPEDYRRFYHLIDGQPVRHDRVHNLYGAGMTKATAEGLRRYSPDRRYLLFSRSSFIGAHRDGGVWQGDNSSWWSHLKMAMQMLPNLNLCGFLYSGCDLGGFGRDTTEDLVERFLQLGVFMPLMRNHSALGTRDQEIYRFSIWPMMRDTVSVRYALLPYLYSEFMKAALGDGMLFRPLAFDYPEDRRAVGTEDQLMWGEGCMIAPVYTQNATGRYVYLPEEMLMIRFRSASDYDLVPLERGDHYIELGLGEFPLFVKKGHVVPLCAGGENVKTLDESRFTVLGSAPEGAEYRLYRDDGLCPQPELERGLTVMRVPPQESRGSWEG